MLQYNPQKFNTYGFKTLNVPNYGMSIKEYIELLLVNELQIMEKTGFETNLSKRLHAKQYVTIKDNVLKTSYSAFNINSEEQWKKSISYDLTKLLQNHIFTKYKDKKPIKNKHLSNNIDYDLACTCKLITNTIAINQEEKSNVLYLDIDDSNGIEIALKIKDYFETDFLAIEKSASDRCHVAFKISYFLDDSELSLLQVHICQKFKCKIDIRRTTTVMRYWNSHSYQTGFIDNNVFVPFKSHEDWQNNILNINPVNIKIENFVKKFLPEKFIYDFNKRNNIKQSYKLNMTTEAYYRNTFDFSKNKTKSDLSKFYYSAGERHNTIFNKGLAIYAYSICNNNYEIFKEIILSFDMGSEGHKTNSEKLIQGYWNSVKKLNIDSKDSSFKSSNGRPMLFDNSDLLDNSVKNEIKKLATFIIKSEFKKKAYTQEWLKLYPEFLNIIIAREYIKQESKSCVKVSGEITSKLKKQLEQRYMYKFLSTSEIKSFVKNFPQFKSNKFNVYKALKLFVKYTCVKKEFKVNNSYNQKTITYIPFIISTRYIFNTKSKCNNFIHNLLFSISNIFNSFKKQYLSLYNTYNNIIMFNTPCIKDIVNPYKRYQIESLL